MTKIVCIGVVLVLLGMGCNAGYMLRSTYFQLELLSYAVPLDSVEGTLTPRQEDALRRIERVRTFARRQGLEADENYTTLARDWPRQLFNVSACEPLAFTPVTWTFPIVGEVPYLGFFERKDAFEILRELEERGVDIYARKVRAYSTLGWFNDPILPHMLEWDDLELARVLLHEMTHATLWVPGSVRFNESLANFVGDHLAMGYLREMYGADSVEFRHVIERLEDQRTWVHVLWSLYRDLETVYADSTSDLVKKEEKTRLFHSLPKRVQAASFHHNQGYLRAAKADSWNNARLVQFRAYNDLSDAFQAVLDKCQGSIPRFLEALDDLPSQLGEPRQALETLATRL